LKKLTKKQKKKLEKRERNKKDDEWRYQVRLRDNGRCVICGKCLYVDCHHFLPREQKETRFEIDNGIVLCKSHHKWSLECSPHRNAFSFFIWFMNNKPEQYQRLKKLIT